MKKLTSVLLSVVMLMSVLCMPTQAADETDCLRMAASLDAQTGDVTVSFIAEQVTTNGRFTVDYNRDYLEFVKASVEGIVINVIAEDGTLDISYATTTGDAVESGEKVATLSFSSVRSWTYTAIDAKVTQFNSFEDLNVTLPTLDIRSSGAFDPDPDPTPTPPVDPIPTPPVTPNPGPSTPVDPTPTPGGDDEEDTEITIDPDGTVTETTTNEDGSTTTTVETPEGTTSTVVTDEDGNMVEASAQITETVASGETVTIPVEVPAASSSEDAVSVKITVPETVETVTVEIPVTDVTPGSVVVLVHEDGTEEIVAKSALTENGLAITVDGTVTVKVIDNSKDFNDTKDHWAEDAVTFVTSRELFNGVSEDQFGADTEMTRAMLMTVLARLDGQDTTNGSTWYEQGMEWAKENGISDGTNPDGNITREQLATMLYRYAGEPATNGELDSFADGGDVSDYAAAAMQWAVENGLINGMGDGSLNPKGEATRAQLAKILMFFINL